MAQNVLSLFRNLKEYDPKAYWGKRVNPNAPAGEKADRVRFDIAYIRQMLGDAKRVLDLGPGVGRLFGAYRPDQRIETLDISTLYREQIVQKANEHDLNVSQHLLDEPLDRFPFEDDAFEAGVVFQVFLHQPPEIFSRQFAEMLRVCPRFVVATGCSANTPRAPDNRAKHVFAHDYLHEASSLGAIVDNVIVRDNCLYLEVTRATDTAKLLRE